MDKLQRIAQSFQNINLDNQTEEGRKIGKKQFINTLNYIHFQAGTILLHFKHPKYNTVISIHARPQPCFENSLDCLWVEPAGLQQKLRSYKFLHLLLTDGKKMILVKASLITIRNEGIRFNLPESGYELDQQNAKWQSCEGVQVDFIQNGTIFCGHLLGFSAVSFCIEASVVPPQSFYWLNPEDTVYIIFKNKQDILYSGECKILRQTCDQKTRSFILEPVKNRINKFKPKKYRSLRHKLSPSPNIIFRHPFIQKRINLEVEDLSGSGLSVVEYQDDSVLLPGMTIPEMYVEFANDFKIKCKAQVVYRNTSRTKDDKTYIRCGIVFLDMDIYDQGKLSGILHHVANKQTYVCNQVDLDSLWRFFFEAGFIYPGKYVLLHANKERFKETYEKLYIQNPHIARHFIYQDKGIIQGHIAMIRFYENTWLIHHHAASKSGYSKAGIVVLNQVGRYINDFHRLDSTHMNFVGCYFRPNNRFPSRVFGGCAREINEPKGCSVDPFAYFHYQKNSSQMEITSPWTLAMTQSEDLTELESFYEYTSGGLMLHALDLEPDMIDSDNLSKEYQKLGFKRERHLFSLKKDDVIKAVIMVTVSDAGLNMSDLTNCIHVVVLDAKDIPPATLNITLATLSKYCEQEEIPVLIYPVSYAESQSIPFDKVYNLWVLNMQYTDDYFKSLENIFHRTHKNNEI